MLKLVVVCTVLVFSSTMSFADGGCPERPANHQERAAYESAYNAAKASVPPAPKDWVMEDATDGNTGQSVPNCPKSANDRPVYYWLKFKYNFDEKVSDQSDQAVVTDALKGTPAQQARMAELDKKIDELDDARKQARKNRNEAEQNRIKDELKAAKREQSKIKDEINDTYMKKMMSGQISEDMQRSKPAREDAEVVIKVNEEHAWIPVRDKPVKLAGARQAYWCPEDNGGRLVILLGAWDAATMESKLTKTSVVTKPQNMIIEITAEQQMAESLARQMKLDLLKRQLN